MQKVLFIFLILFGVTAVVNGQSESKIVLADSLFEAKRYTQSLEIYKNATVWCFGLPVVPKCPFGIGLFDKSRSRASGPPRTPQKPPEGPKGPNRDHKDTQKAPKLHKKTKESTQSASNETKA